MSSRLLKTEAPFFPTLHQRLMHKKQHSPKNMYIIMLRDPTDVLVLVNPTSSFDPLSRVCQ